MKPLPKGGEHKMKDLPKEFQFKCDEHSYKQCELLGIDVQHYELDSIDYYYLVDEKILVALNEDKLNGVDIINLSDYIEEGTEEQKIERLLNEAILSMPREELNKIVQKVNAMSINEEAPDHSELIVEMTKENIKLLNDKSWSREYLVNKAINLAEETISQLQLKGYLK